MKKIVRVLSMIVAPLIAVVGFLTGCKGKPVEVDNGEIMQDIDVDPSTLNIEPAYKSATEAVYAAYAEVAGRHLVDGEIDFENEEVAAAAREAAAKLYAYACYNERTLDKYVYFSDQDGDTDLGGLGSANATRQEYYLRINESDETCGYRFHSTLKKVNESSGAVGTFKSSFESARIRMTDKTDLLYRFEGKNIIEGEYNEALDATLLTCEWSTGKDWGVPDVVMQKGDYIEPDKIEEDIINYADDDNHTIRGNINILAENIVKSAMVFTDDDNCINVMMNIDTDVANSDEASLKMLRKANGSDDCRWEKGDEDAEATGIAEDTGLKIIFRVWGNGLFRSYSVIERWSGKISGFAGTAESSTTTYYSYSDRDCDMTEHLEMLAQAKSAKGDEE